MTLNAEDVLKQLCRMFPGLVDGEQEVNGADLVDELALRISLWDKLEEVSNDQKSV